MESVERRGSAVPPSERIVEAIADESERSLTDLEPLYHTLDPDSLNALLTGQQTGRGQRACRVTFRHEGHCVTVAADGSLDVDTAVEDDSAPG